MDRRATLTVLTGKRIKNQGLSDVWNASNFSRRENTARPVLSLQPYTGTFGFDQAAHLLRRTMFGPTLQQIKEAVAAGLNATIEQLFSPLPLPAPPLNHNYTDDPYVPIGQTWVDKPFVPGEQGVRTYRNQSLRAWTIGLLLNEGVSIREKLTLFWHNHFVTSNIGDARYVYKYITLLRQYAWGNFRELTKKITIDPAMLRYLNGNDNTAAAPNENYARELLELFTIGKGPLAGPGDYTHYTEQDVVQMARILTGWRDRGYFSGNPDLQPEAQFVLSRHDTGSKQLSHRFDHAVVNNLGNQEYAHLIDIIFTKDECARFICRKLYRWFVYYVIDNEVETHVIEPMAQILIANDYEIRPALEALLRSEHFFDSLRFGPMIKHPIDYVMSLLKTTKVKYPDNTLNQRYTLWLRTQRNFLEDMQMVYYDPPEVAGWKAWYQEPIYYRAWISAPTLNARAYFVKTMLNNGLAFMGARAKVNVLEFAASMDDPYDPNRLLEDMTRTLLPRPLTANQMAYLKSVLLPGLPDYEWTIEYAAHVANPNDTNLSASVETKLKNALSAILNLPEFHLS